MRLAGPLLWDAPAGKRLHELDPAAEADHAERQWAIVRTVLAEPRSSDGEDGEDDEEDDEADDDEEDHGSTTLDEPWKVWVCERCIRSASVEFCSQACTHGGRGRIHRAAHSQEVQRHIAQLRDHSDRQAGMLAAQAREHAAQLQFADAELQAERTAAAAALATERSVRECFLTDAAHFCLGSLLDWRGGVRQSWHAKEAELRRAAEESAMLVSSLRETVAALTATGEERALSLAQTLATVERTTGDLDNARAAISALQADVADVATERDRARAELAATKARSDAEAVAYAADLAHVRSELAQTATELGSVSTQLDATIASAQTQASEQAALLRAAAAEHAQMEADLALVRADLAAATARAASEAATAEATIAALRGEVEAATTCLRTVQAAHDAAAAERDRNQETAVAAQAEAAMLKRTLERVDEEHHAAAAAAATELAAHRDQVWTHPL